MAREVELKLEVNSEHVPLLLQDPLFAQTETHSVKQLTIYYDTPKSALRKHGFTLRVRSAGGRFVQTVKPTTEQIGLIQREEVEQEIDSLAPDFAALSGHPVAALAAASDLRPVTRSEVTRRTGIVKRGDARIRLDFDQGTVAVGDRLEQFAELEMELLDGAAASLIVTARQLADNVPVRIGVLTKAERGSRLAAGTSGKIFKAGTVHVDDTMSVGEAFETIVHACLKHYRLNEPLVIHRQKPEALHQARVAMRRLRSALTLFKPAIQDVEFEHLRLELRWFTAQLGDARNLDVYLQRELGDEERARLNAQRQLAYDSVSQAMNSKRFRRLLIDLVGWAAIGAWRRGKPALAPVEQFAHDRLDKLWRSIATAGQKIDRMYEVTRHELRIQVKKMRYAIEFLQGLYPGARAVEQQFSDAVTALQESLGNLNDLATARTFGAAPQNSWLIGSYEERRHLKTAKDAYRGLLAAGPFWRVHAHA